MDYALKSSNMEPFRKPICEEKCLLRIKHLKRVNGVCKHIESFPTVESHYTMNRSKRQYLNGDLSITKMYTMYKDKCVIEKKKPVTEKVYRNIFCKNYNYSFHKPKKDQCSFCTLYLQHKMNGTLTPEMENVLKTHGK